MTARRHNEETAVQLHRSITPAGALAALALLSVQAAQAADAKPNRLPQGVRGVVESIYDGVSNDLLTAGLGKTGLMGTTPAYVNPAAPTAAELRRNAIYVNYRALVDYTASGGMGVFYGPNIDVHGQDTLGEGKVPGREFIAWSDDGSGQRNVALMVQIPDSFNPAAPCIISATSSGSRGIYGAIATAGEWGLKRGCAVAYTDKGTGNGLHDLVSGVVIARDGTLLNAATAGTEAGFVAQMTEEQRAAFNSATPNRVAYKHAHSQRNPEKDWGRHTLEAIKLAFWAINERFGAPDPKRPGRHLASITPEQTLVIASSVSNGGGAALAAAEQDHAGLIDGVAVSEPNATPQGTHRVNIWQGANKVQTVGRPLVDYFTLANVYQPCALLSDQAGLSLNAAFWPAAFTTIAQNRCAALASKGLVTGATLAEQANDALARMLAYGWQPESNFLQQSHFRFATNSIAVTYVNAAGGFSVLDNVCGYSMANTDANGNPIAQVPVVQAGIFASGNGVPPTSGVNIVYNPSVGGAKLDFVAISPSTNQFDFGLDGALCLRSLALGVDAVTGAPLPQEMALQSYRVRGGMDSVRPLGRLKGKPTVIVAGRNDALLPVNHTARAYYAVNQIKEAADNVRLIEVTNAQHFDGFIAFGALMGYDTRFIPLHVYFNRAMDAMWAHLKDGTPLPPSQVVRTLPRGGITGAAPALTAANVPPIAAAPLAGDLITLQRNRLYVPD
ncbi:D-(-)-3-hydroxybutyrate oligomer hydrolase [Ideonella alba]|uniref:D-(-)-3-hydroxybutyrate oligomer hydrolase n=1 Tax=Ideonella alba TaxID=2824118 RepID=A0A940YCG9_9BURK|nr:D-(-)-3-hydroxybutyrate oligomer hydrolase [Ideonella alba]